jgi:plastocyanin
MRSGGVQGTRAVLALAGCVALVAAATGCGAAGSHDNLVNGKEQFVAKCGACHTLARAGSKGTNGPNLDEAFERARKDGLGESTFAGVVLKQIQIPAIRPQHDPQDAKKALALMPPDLVKGDDAEDVAAYVGMAAAKTGEDAGRLGEVGVKKAEGVAKAENGEVEIDADPGGSLAYVFAGAEAPAGALTLLSKNESSVPHNIAVEGNGVNEEGEVVTGGGVSKVGFDAKPGEYTFYCSVPGHREGGMEGKLTVN